MTSLFRDDVPEPMRAAASRTYTGAWPAIARARAHAKPTAPAPTTTVAMFSRFPKQMTENE
jgi:hypothetical protein